MRSNPVLDQLRHSIGRELTKSPSPVGSGEGGTLLAAEEGSLTVTFSFREEMANPAGVVHGGIMATMMDDFMGMTVFALGRAEPFTSINLSIDFLRSARPGETITARSEIVRAGRTVIHATCELRNDAGQLLARAASNLVWHSGASPTAREGSLDA